MFDEVINHVVARIGQSPIIAEPYPHIVVDNVFPEPFYTALQSNLMQDAEYRPLADLGRVGKSYSRARLIYTPVVESAVGSPAREFWRDLFRAFGVASFTKFWIWRFRPHIVERLSNDPRFSKVIGDIVFKPDLLLMRDTESYTLGPHTDSPRKAVSALFYLPPDDRHPELGTSLYLPKARGFTCGGGPHHARSQFGLAKTVEFKPNRVFAFPKSAVCFHGVEPVAAGIRRDLLLFDVYLKAP